MSRSSRCITLAGRTCKVFGSGSRIGRSGQWAWYLYLSSIISVPAPLEKEAFVATPLIKIQHPLLFKDLFDYVAPQITSILEDWDNTDNSEKIYPANKDSHTTLERCKVACEADKLCFQFLYNGTTCALSHHIRLGRKRSPEENGAQRYISGWNVERILDWTMKTDCARAHWLRSNP